MKNAGLKENSSHGTTLFPLHVYTHLDTTGKYSVPFHWHEEIEIVYIESGEFEITIDMNTIKAKAGDCFFINSQQLHLINAKNYKPSLHHAIVFTPQIMSCSFFDYCESNYINPIINKLLSFPVLIDKSTDIGTKIINETIDIIITYKNKIPGWQLSIKSSLFKIISLFASEDLLINNTGTSLTKKGYKIELIKNIVNYIHNNYSNKIYIEDLANEANMNAQYFCRFFKSIVGKTPVDYINSHRIERACEILKTQDIPILDVSLNVGFENFSYFIKQFKKYKNCTPSHFRKQSNDETI